MEPKHIAISLHKDVATWAETNKKELSDTYESRSDIINGLVRAQVELNIPILTVYVLSTKQEFENIDIVMDTLNKFFDELAQDPEIIKNQIKVSVIGKWYNLPNRLVESIKGIIDETKDFDKFFLNLCIHYHGKEEILDSAKLISKRILAERLDPNSITEDNIKEDLYTSYFLAPDLMVINGDKRLNGFLLWDSSDAVIYFTGKHWPDFDIRDLKKAIDLFKLMN